MRLEGSYDYIIVGAGSAGATIAHRLVKDAGASAAWVKKTRHWFEMCQTLPFLPHALIIVVHLLEVPICQSQFQHFEMNNIKNPVLAERDGLSNPYEVVIRIDCTVFDARLYRFCRCYPLFVFSWNDVVQNCWHAASILSWETGPRRKC